MKRVILNLSNLYAKCNFMGDKPIKQERYYFATPILSLLPWYRVVLVHQLAINTRGPNYKSRFRFNPQTHWPVTSLSKYK